MNTTPSDENRFATISAITTASMDVLDNLPVVQIHEAYQLIISTLRNGHKLLLCGNGGSAAQAQHLAADLAAAIKLLRRALTELRGWCSL